MVSIRVEVAIRRESAEREIQSYFSLANELSLPAQRLERFAIGFDHFVESTEVGAHVGPALDNVWNLLLHIVAQPVPLFVWATERRQVVGVGVPTRKSQELVVEIGVSLVSIAKYQPGLLLLMSRKIREQPRQRRAEGSNARATMKTVSSMGGRSMKFQMPLKRNLLAFLHVE